MSATPFITPVAVEAWDAWFRWREHGQLCDVTIDATWDRIASCLAGAESGAARDVYRRRLLDAFGRWQLLLDERVLATAGTGRCDWPGDGLVAVLNAAGYVRAPCTPRAKFDHAGFASGAELAACALDDATLIAQESVCARGHLRIGMIGVADALALIGIGYDSPEAPAHVALMAQALADGCLRGSLATARDRGARRAGDAAWQEREHARRTAPDLLADAARFGLRHDGLTAITSQQRMAWLANDVTDALDPLPSRPCAQEFACADGRRCIQSDGYARGLARRIGSSRFNVGLSSAVPVVAQLKLRASAQPWTDEPISYPVRVERKIDADALAACGAMAAELGLENFAWRYCDAPVPRAD